MYRLEELNASSFHYGDCGIDQEGIQNVKTLRKLNASYNTKIKDVNHMCVLEELVATSNCGIDQKGIKNVTTLRKLNILDNYEIKDISHMTELKEFTNAYRELKKEILCYGGKIVKKNKLS